MVVSLAVKHEILRHLEQAVKLPLSPTYKDKLPCAAGALLNFLFYESMSAKIYFSNWYMNRNGFINQADR
jgi:hypothetical protein